MHPVDDRTTSTPTSGWLDTASQTSLSITGVVEIAGRHYITPDRLAETLDVTVRTLARWDAARIGPPKIKVGKTVLYDVGRLPEWLAARETEPVRATGKRR